MSSATRILLDPQRVSDGQVLTFDFASKLAVGQVISGASFVVSVWSGVDPTPAALLSLSTSFVGSQVFKNKNAGGGVVGTIYLISCTVTTTGVTASITLTALLAVIPDGL